MKFSLSLFFSFLLALAFTSTPQLTNANPDLPCLGCVKTLKSRSGTVYAGGPAKTTVSSTSDQVTISVQKKGGKAQTIVNIYVNNKKRTDIVFNNGKYTQKKSKTISNVKGKTIRVDIVNQSVTNKFEYNLKINGETNALGSLSGNLAGQGKKDKTLGVSCDNNVRVVVTRTGGSARANIFVKIGGTTVKSVVMDKREQRRVINVNNARNRRYTVEVKNVSVGNWFKFQMNANSY